jgi:hypothetical protein
MVRRQWAVFGTVAAVVLLVGVGGAFMIGPFSGRAPAQPIPFPHDLHAGTNQIPCMYCHTSADRSRAAGIPSVQVCAGCHIPGGQPIVAADRPGVRMLVAYWQQQRPIPWTRIHNLPDHVQFSHMRHVNAEVPCQTCHGPVETMAEMRQVESLRMGWCVDCHRELGARTDCFVCHY